ncbi:MAG: chaperone modulatory protein CbpM [Verrucomicrobiota bacterium]|jgi:hypothetical protein|nr:chaperone modulatory protein CbpM [Verrucomicrobiota bacterium]MDK2962955.1 chaperone modulatory protein CbpM [Verrucomicrobiota bacterium]
MNSNWDQFIRERQQSGRRRFGRYLTRQQLIALSDIPPRTVEKLLAFELVNRTWIDGQPMFRTEELDRIRRILRLHYDLGVCWSDVDLVLQLIEQIDTLREQLRHNT